MEWQYFNFLLNHALCDQCACDHKDTCSGKGIIINDLDMHLIKFILVKNLKFDDQNHFFPNIDTTVRSNLYKSSHFIKKDWATYVHLEKNSIFIFRLWIFNY